MFLGCLDRFDTQLFQFAIEMGAFKSCFFGNTRHAASFLCQMMFEIDPFEHIPGFTQWQIERQKRCIDDIRVIDRTGGCLKRNAAGYGARS